MHIKIKAKNKSINQLCEFELPNFSVLTGVNGSGKTHLLETISNKQMSEVKIDGRNIQNIKYIPFNGLNPSIATNAPSDWIKIYIKKIWARAESTKQQLLTSVGRQQIRAKKKTDEDFVNRIDAKYRRFVKKALDDSQKSYANLTENDLYNSFDISCISQDDFFTAQFAIVFKSYHRILEENKMNMYYKSQGQDYSGSVLSDEKFREKYGNPPWIFVNKILEEVSLPYELNDPAGTRMDSSFNLKFTDRERGFEINPIDLSTGEKVLMALALAIYNTSDDFNKLDLLLIDEPDAALHPSMTQKMMKILKKTIVEENNIPVIITTHSPTTVIASEGVSIYQLERGNNVPKQIPKQKAVELLSGKIPFLKISTERRRQVFVESKYDVQYYEMLTNILALMETLPAEPIFIPARTSNGSNCTDVIDVVNNLTNNGNDQVYGIIDWDLSNNSSKKIIVLGENERYSIENYLLDPLKMGLFFIRERKIDIEEFGTISFSKYIDAGNMTRVDAQIIINKVLGDLGLLSENKVSYKLYNEWELEISEEFCRHQGHVSSVNVF